MSGADLLGSRFQGVTVNLGGDRDRRTLDDLGIVLVGQEIDNGAVETGGALLVRRDSACVLCAGCLGHHHGGQYAYDGHYGQQLDKGETPLALNNVLKPEHPSFAPFARGEGVGADPLALAHMDVSFSYSGQR